MPYEKIIKAKEQEIKNLEVEIVALQRVMQRLQILRTTAERELEDLHSTKANYERREKDRQNRENLIEAQKDKDVKDKRWG